MAPTVPIEFVGQKESRKCSLSQMMGKSQKYTKGHSTGFVPDYRHAVETMGESEGFGSSVRIDTEVTASEDSYAPKRKCISLNVDGYDGLSVPMQVLSLSRMSQLEKKDLELKLKMELQQVRILQKKIDSLGSNAVVLSPSSEIRSCSDGQKKPPIDSFNRLSEVSAPQGKKRAPPGRNGPHHNKRNASGRFHPVAKPAAPANTSNAMLMKQCENLLNRLMSHQFGWVFNSPVDVVKLNIPDYFTVIKHPMDLGTVKGRIASGKYSSPLDFAAEVRLTFSNAMTYNPPGNDVHVMAETLSKYFEVRWKPIEKKHQAATESQLQPSGPKLETEIIATPVQPAKKKKVAPADSSQKDEAVKQVISEEEKHKLSSELEAMLAELPESIVDFLKEHCQGQDGDEEIEIDIDAFSDDTLVTLRKLVDDYLLEKQKYQANSEPCEMELRHESGFSNCSMQPCKVNEPADEDVDIVGGNDQPVSSFPPVEIEKDATHRNSKCSNSSRSSSDSGPSSSDSEPGNSSDSEADSAKPSVPPIAPKENLNSGESLEQKISEPLGDSEVGNPSLTEVAQAEQNSQSKPVSDGVDDRQEGESAPSERQVSPEKMYRAALLRSRFADTILKAREKALEKGETRDPEKLRMEKEELERRQKEEKARLQAEATAAEEARRKAEQEAAAEAKRKRELEREAARQALQMMEKTVDINENSRFMEDLEMLRISVHDDDEVPNFEEEASPELSQNGLGSFKLQGNPLEKLGLYMKMDDEFEEEEAEPPPSNPEQLNDVEEGEID
ncbi:hypothetical protein TIFTF001_033450 [Ficus carica]|uniref:Uncharacterized protein n=1 Tax=Ficus carica TaxID=3494 RepID=A0AA88DZ76_FICCA|nr:hypothetical protein TIFTF001_033450 [Ficus carica]